MERDEGSRRERRRKIPAAATRRLRALALASTLPAAAFAGSAPLTLGETLARAREGASAVAAASARVVAATARAESASAMRWPTLRLSEDWLRTDSPADAFALLLNQERFAFADFVAGDPNDPDPLTTAVSRAEVAMPLWTGGELSNRIRQADLAAEAARAGATAAGDGAALAAAEAWVALARAREALAVLETARGTVAAHARLAADFEAQGMLVRSERLRAEVELAALDDRIAGARGEAELAEAALAFRLGEPLDARYVLAPLGDPPVFTLDPEVDGVDRGVADRSDLEAARKALAAAALEADALGGIFRPQLGVFARHDWVDDRPFGTHGDGTTIGARLSIELFDGGRRRNAIAAARAEADAGRAELAERTAAARLEAKGAFTAARSADSRLATAGAATRAAEETVRIVEERFRAGILRTTDLLDATTARREAALRELVARADAWLARLRLAAATGRRPETALGATIVADSTAE